MSMFPLKWYKDLLHSRDFLLDVTWQSLWPCFPIPHPKCKHNQCPKTLETKLIRIKLFTSIASKFLPDINRILSNLIQESCVSTSLMPEKLLMEHAMLLAILSSHTGSEVGKFVFISSSAECCISQLGKSIIFWLFSLT